MMKNSSSRMAEDEIRGRLSSERRAGGRVLGGWKYEKEKGRQRERGGHRGLVGRVEEGMRGDRKKRGRE